MKNGFILTKMAIVKSIKRTSVVQLAVLLCVLAVLLTGCQQAGETTAHGQRRHLRNMTINQESLNSDLDRALLFDRSSRLTPLKIPPEIDE